MESLQKEFKSGMYKIGNFLVHIVTNPITTIEGVRLNWDALQNPTEIKVFLSGLIGLMVFAAMPDDVIKNGVDSFNRKFKSKTPIETDEIPQEVPQEVPKAIIQETMVSTPTEEITTVIAVEPLIKTKTNEQSNPISLSTSRPYQPGRFRRESPKNSD